MIKKFFQKHPTLWEVFKFLLIGGSATVIDFLAMSLTLYLFKPKAYGGLIDVFFGSVYSPTLTATVVGTAVGFAFGLIFNYIFSLIFVFTAKDTTRARSPLGFAAFAGLSVIGLAIHVLGMYVGYDVLKINEWVVKIILTVIVMIFNYLSRKYLLFNKNKS